jgi:hypothetical protein
MKSNSSKNSSSEDTIKNQYHQHHAYTHEKHAGKTIETIISHKPYKGNKTYADVT